MKYLLLTLRKSIADLQEIQFLNHVHKKKPTVKSPFNVADRNKRFISRKAIIISKSLHGD